MTSSLMCFTISFWFEVCISCRFGGVTPPNLPLLSDVRTDGRSDGRTDGHHYLFIFTSRSNKSTRYGAANPMTPAIWGLLPHAELRGYYSFYIPVYIFHVHEIIRLLYCAYWITKWIKTYFSKPVTLLMCALGFEPACLSKHNLLCCHSWHQSPWRLSYCFIILDMSLSCQSGRSFN